MNTERHTVNHQPNPEVVQSEAMDFAQIPATLITHKSEPCLRITARGKQAKTSCAIIPLTTYSTTPEETKSSLFLASFHSEHGNHIRAVALNDEIAYPRQLLRLLREVFNHPDTQHIASLRPGHWKRICVEHSVHANDSMPGFKFTLTIKRTRLKTRIRRTDTDDVQTLPFSIDCLNCSLGDMLAGILREHYTTDDLPDCPVDWGLI